MCKTVEQPDQTLTQVSVPPRIPDAAGTAKQAVTQSAEVFYPRVALSRLLTLFCLSCTRLRVHFPVEQGKLTSFVRFSRDKMFYIFCSRVFFSLGI